MADRFPSLEDFDSGGMPSKPKPKPFHRIPFPHHFTDQQLAQTQSKGDSGFEAAGTDDFLSREKALLGDDADQFATGNDNAAFMDDDEDLLGGGGGGRSEEATEFESSFPAIDTQNEVGCSFSPSSWNALLCVRSIGGGGEYGIWTLRGCLVALLGPVSFQLAVLNSDSILCHAA